MIWLLAFLIVAPQDDRTTADTVHSWWFQKQTQIHVLAQLVELWGEYKDSRKTDSLMVYIHTDYLPESLEWIFIETRQKHRYDEQYWYRRRPTLDGFMDFIRRRVVDPAQTGYIQTPIGPSPNMEQFIGRPPDSEAQEMDKRRKP